MEQTLEEKISAIIVDNIFNPISMQQALAAFFKQELEQERRKAFEAAREAMVDSDMVYIEKYPDYESYLASLKENIKTNQ